MVSVFSRPQKMVFDCVYGRRKGGCDKKQIRRPVGRQHVTIPHPLCTAIRVCGGAGWGRREPAGSGTQAAFV